jgi:hypothetical protein
VFFLYEFFTIKFKEDTKALPKKLPIRKSVTFENKRKKY